MDKKLLIALKNITAGYQKPVLKQVNFKVYSDDFIGIIGPNGGGKTTLIKVILNLLKPQSGTLQSYIDSNGIGYLPQVNQHDKDFPITVFEVVQSGLMNNRYLGLFSYRNTRHKIEETLDFIGIKHLINKPIGELSGGQMQRVFLCRAIISDPELLILDEPETFVDNQFEGELYEHLQRLNKKMAIIVISHDLGTISSYVKSIACVNETLHHHPSNIITEQQLSTYNCPIQLISHGQVPHTILKSHTHE